MWRKLTALLLLCMTLCSCSVLKESGFEVQTPVGQVQQMPNYVDYTTALYYIDETTGRIARQTQQLQIENWADSPVLIVEALLASGIDLGFGRVNGKVHVQEVCLSGEVGNVYLTSEIKLSDRQQYFLAVLIADTLIQSCGVAYVYVEIDGVPVCMEGIVTGAYSHTEGNMAELYQQQKAYMEGLEDAPYHANVALYYIDGDYVLPEMAGVNTNLKDMEAQIVDTLWQLSKGPRRGGEAVSPLQEEVFSQILTHCSDAELAQYLTYQNGVLTILQGEQLLRCNRAQDVERCLSALFYTLKGVVPELLGVHCYWGGVIYTIDQNQAYGYLGSVVNICLPDEDKTCMRRVSRVVHAAAALDWSTYIRLIGQGPIAGDPPTVSGVFPRGLLASDILSLEVRGDCAVINCSQNLLHALERLTKQGKMIMLYCMVNTLCNTPPVKRVQFLVEGAQIEAIPNSGLSLISPLVESPGLMKQEIS